jgi:heterodisulfide reductase subunit D
MQEMSFETALAERTEEMADACTRCGKCVEVCPSVKPAGIEYTAPQVVIGGVVDILRGGDGSEASRLWAQSCMLSGECVRACDYGVNPRFLLAMARVAMKRADEELPQRRRAGAEAIRKLQRDVTVLSRLQLSPRDLERLGQRARGASANAGTAAKQDEPTRARLRLLHRLQRAEDAAYRAARARHHGPARHPLSRAGRT